MAELLRRSAIILRSMPSSALVGWQTFRRKRLDEIVAAHQAVGGAGPGRRWRTKELNWALTLRLAGEFQGFARDLYDLAAEYVAAMASSGNSPLEQVMLRQANTQRLLDRGNASPDTLGHDFARFGMTLWSALLQAEARSAAWKTSLAKLNEARNAIAHVNDAQIQNLHVTLRVVRKWRRDLDLLAACMDDVVSAYLDGLIGRGRPW